MEYMEYKKSPDCCGCASFPYALCGPCYRYNYKMKDYTIMNENIKKPTVSDLVNHPKHYTFGTIEVIDVIEDWQLEFHLANTVKYIARAKHKGRELEDLKKAQWYLNRKISQLELDQAAEDDHKEK